MRRIQKYFIPSLLILSIGWFAFTPGDKYFEIVKNLDIFATMFKEVNALYVDEVDPEALVKTGIDAMLESLDPYTTYIPEEEVENFRTSTTGQYAGIGAMIGYLDERVIITMPYKDYAAHSTGLKVGDEVVSIGGIDIKGIPLEEVSGLMKGQVKTKVDIEVRRFGFDKPLAFRIEREKIKVNNIPYYGILKGDIGYIKLEDFTTGAGREVADALTELQNAGAKKIVLDIRDNPGGLLNEAVNVVNVFIPKGKTVVETRGRASEWNKKYKTLDNPVDTEIPLIVLVNEGSASASEIVSGAIQDYDRGILVGRKTYGKGLVQTSRKLAYNSQLKITTAKYYTPSGRCIQAIDYSNKDVNGNGTDIPDSLKAAFKTSRGRIVYDGDGLSPDVVVEDIKEAPVVDALLNEGLLFDYAVEWSYKNQEREFSKNNEEFEKFVHWVEKKDFTYHTEVEEMLEYLKDSAKEEAYLDELQDEIKSLEVAVANDKKNDLIKFKMDILEILEKDISTHRYLLEGKVTASFDDDKDIAAAVQLLQEKDRINQILSRK